MINTTDLQECEILLPGNWERLDNRDVYSFTNDQMKVDDDRLFKELYIDHPEGKGRDAWRYALMIKDDYCGVVINEDEFIIRSITRHPDKSLTMEWKDEAGAIIRFRKAAV